MLFSRYVSAVIGEPHDRLMGLHPTSRRRAQTLALAIHIPVALWAVTAFIIASRLFSVGGDASLGIAAFCAALIYAIERIVIAAPSSLLMAAARVFMGLLIALLGASSFDLVVFAPEVAEQLRLQEKRRLRAELTNDLQALQRETQARHDQWRNSLAAANCEANGTCGSRVASTGPIYRALSQQAGIDRDEFLKAQQAAADRRQAHAADMARAAGDELVSKSGLLNRVQALHDFVQEHDAAKWVWALFVTLIVMLELIVIVSKMSFGKTVDDRIEEVRELAARHRAEAYLDCITSPSGAIRTLIHAPS